MMPSYDVRKIVKTVLNEHDGEGVSDVEAYISSIQSQLEGDADQIPAYTHASSQLSLVRFRCMLQDTGYPMEVYMDSDAQSSSSSSSSAPLDVGNLRERWIGWGVEMPGESTWFKASPETSSSTLASGLSALSLGPASPTAISTPHNAAVQLKYPLPSQRANYLGALIKVYDDSAAFRPASAHTFVGIVSRAALPAAGGEMAEVTGDEDVEGEEERDVIVPAIHVLAGPYASTPTVNISAGGTDEDVEGARSEVVRYLTGILDGDDLAAEYLLLTLLSRPAVRPPSLPPLGTLSLNFISPLSPSNLLPALRQIVPAVVDVPLTIPYLHETAFIPSAPTSTSLNAGLLQLAPDTMLIIDETNIGDGGKLEERAVKNLQAVQQCLNEQKVGYAYPYVPELKMECAVRGLVLSEGGRGIVRADVSLPVRTHPRSGASIASKAGEADQAGDAGRGGRAADMPVETLQRIRAYLLQMGGEAQAKKLSIPDKVGDVIQDAFVSMRAAAQAAAGAPGTAGTGEVGDAEGALKRRMRIARLLAISHADAVLTENVWRRAVEMDEEAQQRLAEQLGKKGAVNGSVA